ncbi:hypothetical protein [Streptomyces sp. PTD5-9]|uniref:hypothetical protein n=1 Tax=Streptomyces sp. PTD5-9 TaxID=3120150 RepID=UPI0030083260
MTSTDTSGHPDVAEISDLTEGLLPPSRADEVRGHLDGCALCDDVHASLIEIRDLLGTVPVPQRMPDDVADRVDAALAAAAVGSAVSDGPAHVSRETTPTRTAEPNAKIPAMDRPAGRPRAATGPGRRSPGPRRRAAVLGTALGAAVIGVSLFLLQSVQPAQDADAPKTAMHDSGSATGDGSTFSESTLEGRVRTLLRHADRQSSTPNGIGPEKQAPSVTTQSTPGNSPQAPEPPSAPLRTPTASVPACVRAGIGLDTPALAVEAGTYEGTNAFLVVLPDRSDPARVQAYVVDAACTRDETVSEGKLLLSHSYARP